MTPKSQLNQISKHYENIDRVMMLKFRTASAAAGESVYAGWIGSLACTQNKIRTVVGVAM